MSYIGKIKANNIADNVITRDKIDDLLNNGVPIAVGVFDGSVANLGLVAGTGFDATTPISLPSNYVYRIKLDSSLIQPDEEYIVIAQAISQTASAPNTYDINEKGNSTTGYLDKTTLTVDVIFGQSGTTTTKRFKILIYRKPQ